MTNYKPNLLAIGPQNVYPPTDGGKEGIFGALSALCDYFDVTYAYFKSEGQTENLSGYLSVGIRPYPINYVPAESFILMARATLLMRPFKFYKYSNPAAVHAYCKAIPQKEYSLLLCFHAHTWKLGEAVGRQLGLTAPVLVREHNIEYEIVASYKSSLSFVSKIAGDFYYRLTRREEMQMWHQADAVAFLSTRDLSTAKKIVPEGRLFLAPEGIPIPPKRKANYPGSNAPLLMLLNPNAKQSVMNMKQFVFRYWADICKDSRIVNTRLRITGLSQEQLANVLCLMPRELEEMRIDGLGFVPILNAEFASCLALISPTFYGGGIRKKILEAMAHQVPVIASKLDVVSTDYFRVNENIRCFDDCEDGLTNAIVDLTQDENRWYRLSSIGRETVKKYAAWKLFADAIIEEFECLTSGSDVHE